MESSDRIRQGPHECSEEVLAALEDAAVEDVVMRAAEADEVQGVAETRATAHPGRFDMRLISPGFMAAGNQAFGALPADDRLDQLGFRQLGGCQRNGRRVHDQATSHR
jgi:hypothetical protein